jgi:phosphopentomutase
MHYDGMRGSSGTRETLADIAATMAVYFQLKEKWPTGKSLLTPAKVRAHRHKHLH